MFLLSCSCSPVHHFALLDPSRPYTCSCFPGHHLALTPARSISPIHLLVLSWLPFRPYTCSCSAGHHLALLSARSISPLYLLVLSWSPFCLYPCSTELALTRARAVDHHFAHSGPPPASCAVLSRAPKQSGRGSGKYQIARADGAGCHSRGQSEPLYPLKLLAKRTHTPSTRCAHAKHAKHMQNTRKVHAKHTQSTCKTHAKYMQNTRTVYAKHTLTLQRAGAGACSFTWQQNGTLQVASGALDRAMAEAAKLDQARQVGCRKQSLYLSACPSHPRRFVRGSIWLFSLLTWSARAP
jgi:hypothetical protein